MVDIRWLTSIEQIAVEQWNRLLDNDNPFMQHGFLRALERSGAVCRETGWQPRHALFFRNQQLVGLLPGYRKWHSYGEYVFDFSWADAYDRHGRQYFPKYLSAIPFTPSSGPRLCVANGEDPAALARRLCQALELEGDTGDEAVSSWHLLFADEHQHRSLTPPLMLRQGMQFHWFNRNYSDFDSFLVALRSRHRKAIRKERRAVQEQSIELERLSGDQIDASIWKIFHQFYQLTYLKRSGHRGYLPLEFFQQLGDSLPEQLMMVVARHQGRIVAAALNLRDSEKLYGRYWGCLQEFDFLHFETCYYQGIEYCIEQGLKCFDAGAQGQHKIKRGFEPVTTYSSHWIRDEDFKGAIEHFLQQEQRYLEQEMAAARTLLPYTKTEQ
ncbi:GNAT family N-acetyltransferase [Aestuariirhabdus sp. Z084]|uniref:GNAT family N-acetyltransferase n=1 Tax=Aestuariirhabdus haliotis TaxID=2918751 RepID=UPI00201B4207|nr:GNAT family N-acetyltransferase [Aestuariirhabdus haliotis]MCL6414092.1 GNAT family N-acetyltransferase [Aestuariirhabdus haliotis]MCL6418024.1 GNAT family N-acetyltransferase [Aestuariirhabdus haliotis]